MRGVGLKRPEYKPTDADEFLASDLRRWENCLAATAEVEDVYALAADMGGMGFISANHASILRNALISIHTLHAARENVVRRYLYASSACVYPEYAQTEADIAPLREEDAHPAHPQDAYRWEKLNSSDHCRVNLVGCILCASASEDPINRYRQQYGLNAIYLLPVSLYGPGDSFDPERSHVIPAMINKCLDAIERDAPKIEGWGTGEASREFLFVEDCARAIVLAATRYDKPDPVNLGTGREVKIRELVRVIVELTSFKGDIVWDMSKRDGQPRRCLDVSRAEREFGFRASIDLETGLRRTVEWYSRIRAQNNPIAKHASPLG